MRAAYRDSPSSMTATEDNSPSALQSHKCLWADCSQSFSTPEILYNHLCNDHIGRKSTNNLCLTCKWKDCGTTCAKRDHITSHLRVHTPLKPHVCDVCKKSFKRPQDLKKHEKIHTEEHHAQHKHSKAITVVDPSYVERVRGMDSHSLSRPAHTDRRSDSGSPYPADALGMLPTPSPELHHAAQFDRSTWQSLRPSSDGVAGSKRSHDYSPSGVDDFFTDVKKRRVNPNYDCGMAERLNSLSSYNHPSYPSPNYPISASFNPRTVRFDIRTPEELAAVNEFLITLGRDVGRRSPHSQTQSSRASGSPDYFDQRTLEQLGLVNMPISSYPSPPHHPAQPQQSYPTSRGYEEYSDYSRRVLHQSSPPHDGSSPHSVHSSTGGSPIPAMAQSDALPLPDSDPSAQFDFLRAPRGPSVVPTLDVADYLGISGVSGVSVGPHMNTVMRAQIPLKSAPPLSSSEDQGNKAKATPMEPKLEAKKESTPARLVSSTNQQHSRGPPSHSTSSSLYPSLSNLLISESQDGGKQYKLAPLKAGNLESSMSSKHSYRSSTPSSIPTTPTLDSASIPSRDGSISPSPAAARGVSLPGIRHIAESMSSSISKTSVLMRDLDISPSKERREADHTQRRRHAELIRDLLIAINRDYRDRFLECSSGPRGRASTREVEKDVEMVAIA